MSIIGRPQPYRMARLNFERFKTTSAQMDFVRKHYFGKLTPNEVALIITRFPHEERMGSTASNVFGDTIYETLYLGILSNEEPLTASYKDGQSLLGDDLRIPTEKYYSSSQGYRSEGVQCGPIRLSSMDFHRLGDSIAEPIREWWHGDTLFVERFVRDEKDNPVDVYPIEVAMGHKAIQTLCAKHDSYRDFYIVACNALGLMPRLSPPLAKHAKIERAKIVFRMIELLDKIGVRSAHIDWVMKTAGPGQAIVEGGALTILDSKDDAFWVTFGDRQRRREETEELGRLLQSARAFGMNADSEERLPHPYHPGTEIIAGQFIAAIEKIAVKNKR